MHASNGVSKFLMPKQSHNIFFLALNNTTAQHVFFIKSYHSDLVTSKVWK